METVISIILVAIMVLCLTCIFANYILEGKKEPLDLGFTLKPTTPHREEQYNNKFSDVIEYASHRFIKFYSYHRDGGLDTLTFVDFSGNYISISFEMMGFRCISNGQFDKSIQAIDEFVESRCCIERFFF